MALIIPNNYQTKLDIHTTQLAIKDIKDFFQRELACQLNLSRVTAPLFVHPDSGLNDRLNDVERPVSFDILETGEVVEIVHSLAKWKRYALKQYGFQLGEGLYTDMNAIRRDETTDNLHSLYVDQWDWEKIIQKKDRTTQTLEETVSKIYAAMVATETMLTKKYPVLAPVLPPKIHFITSQELEDMYPNLTGKERENAICKKYGAVFISQIGGKLKSGAIHDGRAPDYDDWTMNGDILVWYDVLNVALELSSMGVRVDETSLMEQLSERDVPQRAKLPFQQAVLNQELPYTIGGGIGQSRLCMFFLKKAHIGEVQVSQWPSNMLETCRKAGIHIL